MEHKRITKPLHSCILPSIQRIKNPLASTINNYICTIENSVDSLDYIDGQSNIYKRPKESYSHQPFHKRKAIIKMSCFPEKISIKKNSVLNAYRLRLSKKDNKHINEDNSTQAETITSQTIPAMPSRQRRLTQKKVLQALEMIDRASVSVNQNLLLDLSLYDERNKNFNNKYERIIIENKKTIETADEYLQPEIIDHFRNKHSSLFYSNLDNVIRKVSGSNASMNLLREMKGFNKKKQKKDEMREMKRIKQRERYTKLIDQNELIHNKIYMLG